MNVYRGCCAVAVSGLALLLASAGAKAVVIDQQQTSFDSYIGPGDGQGQSFTPTLNTIDFATFDLAVSDPSSEIVFATLIGGDGFGGSLLGVSNEDLVASGSFAQYQFDFSPGISLTPGQVYTLELNNGFGDLFALEKDGNPYAGGTEYNSSGVVQPSYDLTFTEGANASAVPEPQAALMFPVMGLIGLGAWAVRRRFGAFGLPAGSCLSRAASHKP
jgi:hypothetical protein